MEREARSTTAPGCKESAGTSSPASPTVARADSSPAAPDPTSAWQTPSQERQLSPGSPQKWADEDHATKFCRNRSPILLGG